MRTLTVALAIALSAVAFAQDSPAPVTVPNGGMEEGQDVPTDWQFSTGEGGTGEARLDT